MKKVAQTYSVIRIVTIPPNIWSLNRKFGKRRSNVLRPPTYETYEQVRWYTDKF